MSSLASAPAEAVHRLLFHALVQMRAEGAAGGNKVVYHLADLFHRVVLEMERAARGEQSYDEVLRFAEDEARERGLAGWLDSTARLIESANTPVP